MSRETLTNASRQCGNIVTTTQKGNTMNKTTTTVAVTFQFRTDTPHDEAAFRRRIIRDLTILAEGYGSKGLDKGHSFIGIDQTPQLQYPVVG